MVEADAEQSAYLTDGHGLYRIVRVLKERGEVLLEDCSCPETACLTYHVRDLVADGFVVVRSVA